MEGYASPTDKQESRQGLQMSTHASHEMHENSLETFRQERAALQGRSLEVYKVIAAYGPLTDREIRKQLGFHDMNTVRPRVTELIQKGWAIESGTVVDFDTRKKVRLVKAVPENKVSETPDLFGYLM